MKLLTLIILILGRYDVEVIADPVPVAPAAQPETLPAPPKPVIDVDVADFPCPPCEEMKAADWTDAPFEMRFAVRPGRRLYPYTHWTANGREWFIEGSETKPNLVARWRRTQPLSASHITAAFAAGAGAEYQLPRMTVNPTTKAVTISESITIPYGDKVSVDLKQGCTLSLTPDGSYVFSQPYPRVRVHYVLTWDGSVRRINVNSAKRVATVSIDGLPDQVLGF